MLSLFLLAAIISLASMQHTSLQQRRGVLYREIAHRAAESGVERAIQRLTANRTFTTSASGVTEGCTWDAGLPGVTTNCSYTYIVRSWNNCPSPPPGGGIPGDAKCIMSKATLLLNGSVAAERSIATIVSFDPSEFRLIHHFWRED